MAARMMLTSDSRRFRFAILPVASRSSAELWRRSCQSRTRRATQPLERATSHASAKTATMTTTCPNGGYKGVFELRRSMRGSNTVGACLLSGTHRIDARPSVSTIRPRS